MSKNNKTYRYSGPVVSTEGFLYERNWVTETWAPSKKKALSNLKFRYKRDNNIPYGVTLDLPGKLEEVLNGHE